MLDENQIHKALALRAIGGTYASISSQTGVSVSSLQIIFKKYALEKGEITQGIYQRAKKEMMDDTDLAEEMRREFKTLVLSEIQLGKRLLDSAAITLEQLDSISPLPKAKALSSIAATIQTASNIVRKSLGDEELEQKDLPSLTIRKMTDNETDEVRRRAECGAEYP